MKLAYLTDSVCYDLPNDTVFQSGYRRISRYIAIEPPIYSR